MTTFLTKIDEKGELNFGSDFNLARFHDYCKMNKGKILKIKPEITTRTLSQNNLYWLYLGVIERETGNDSNDLHELFKRTLLPPKFIKVMGKEIKIPKSTNELRKDEFSDYMEKINAETSIPIPNTEQYLREIDLAPTI